MTKKITTRFIAANGIVAAIYFALTMLSYPIAFGDINFRISELMVLLCYWRPDFTIGITLGCFLANIFSSLGPWDMLFGTAATLIACLFVVVSPKLLIGCFWPIAVNAFIVGFELNWLSGSNFWAMVGAVAIGETTVIIISYIVWMIMWRKNLPGLLKAKRKLEPNW